MMPHYKRKKPMQAPANSGKENACSHFRFTGEAKRKFPTMQQILKNPFRYTAEQRRAAAWYQFLTK
jgi:hypothetical protein